MAVPGLCEIELPHASVQLFEDCRLGRSRFARSECMRISHAGRGDASASRREDARRAGFRHAHRGQRHGNGIDGGSSPRVHDAHALPRGDDSGADADAVLHGTILKQTVAPLTYNTATQQSSSFVITIVAFVTLTAHDGRVLYEKELRLSRAIPVLHRPANIHPGRSRGHSAPLARVCAPLMPTFSKASENDPHRAQFCIDTIDAALLSFRLVV